MVNFTEYVYNVFSGFTLLAQIVARVLRYISFVVKTFPEDGRSITGAKLQRLHCTTYGYRPDRKGTCEPFSFLFSFHAARRGGKDSEQN